MSGVAQDRGLHALARVREVRERDSRLGLHQALQEQQERQVELDALDEHLRRQAGFTVQDTSHFVAARAALVALRGTVEAARSALDSASSLSCAAEAHWQSDRTRLAAVEHLLEARADVRRAEGERAEAKVMDETATRGWLRQQEGRA